MNKLFIEVHNKIIKAYIINIHDYKLLMSTEYENTSEWEKNLRYDVDQIDEELVDYSIFFYTKKTIIGTEIFDHQVVQLEKKKLKKKIKNKLIKDHINYHLASFSTLFRFKRAGIYEIRTIYELVDKYEASTYISGISSEGFTTKPLILSTTNNFKTELSKYDSNILINIHVEENTMMANVVSGNRLLETKKYNIGLSKAIETISAKMNLKYEKAKSLFMNFGNIPPEAVKDDRIIVSNKDINGKEQLFTKKDLSGYITNYVDNIINILAFDYQEYLEKEIKLVLSGDILTLNGLKQYISTKLKLLDIQIHESNIFGFHSLNNISICGALKREKLKYEKEVKEGMHSKENSWIIRMIKILRKENKYV